MNTENKTFSLNKQDKQTLIGLGHEVDDFKQIQQAGRSKKSKYYFVVEKDNKETKEEITWQKALELLGHEQFLSGLGRASFHCSAVRYLDGGIHFSDNGEPKEYVLFNMYYCIRICFKEKRIFNKSRIFRRRSTI